jgi:hypothetical protein
VAKRVRWLLFVGVGLALVLAFPAGALASSPPNPLGTWTSWFTCTAGCGGTYQHTTVINKFSQSTGDFSGTDSNGPVTGTVTGSRFSMRTVVGNPYQFHLSGTIGTANGFECWTGFLIAQNGSGTWTGSLGPAATESSLTRCSSSPATAGSEVSSIAASLASPSHAFSSVKSDVVDGLITVGLALFLTFPANLFNSTFQENYADMVAWWEKWTAIFFPLGLRRALGKLYRTVKGAALGALRLSGRSAGKRREREKATFASVLLVGSLLGALLDPVFGLNFRTVISFVAIVIAMAAGVALSGFITVGYHRARKHGKVPYKLEALPIGLVIAAVCVVVSRASGFSPGYLYGVICGVGFTRELSANEEGHVVALGAWAKVALAVLAWLAWSAITHDASKPGSFFGTVLLDDFLASLFVSSLVGTVISLFPLRFLPGDKLRSWHKGAWAATFGVTLFALVQVLLRPHSTSSGPSHAPLVTTVVLFVLFAVGSVIFREHFARKHRRDDQDPIATGPTAEGPLAPGGPPGAAEGPPGGAGVGTDGLVEPVG